MFTGLIEKTGKMEWLSSSRRASRIQVSHDPWDTPLACGDSVCVQGICLTVAECSPSGFLCDVLNETRTRTNLQTKDRGAVLNLERAMRMTDRLGGHLVTGHVDGVGSILSMEEEDGDMTIRIQCDISLGIGIVKKGSIACDGISLTVSMIHEDYFEVRIIPETWQRTSLRTARIGEAVNIETDIIGKYVLRHLQAPEASQLLTMDRLHAAGFK